MISSCPTRQIATSWLVWLGKYVRPTLLASSCIKFHRLVVASRYCSVLSCRPCQFHEVIILFKIILYLNNNDVFYACDRSQMKIEDLFQHSSLQESGFQSKELAATGRVLYKQPKFRLDSQYGHDRVCLAA